MGEAPTTPSTPIRDTSHLGHEGPAHHPESSKDAPSTKVTSTKDAPSTRVTSTQPFIQLFQQLRGDPQQVA